MEAAVFFNGVMVKKVELNDGQRAFDASRLLDWALFNLSRERPAIMTWKLGEARAIIPVVS